jgi:hypothetical protein
MHFFRAIWANVTAVQTRRAFPLRSASACTASQVPETGATRVAQQLSLAAETSAAHPSTAISAGAAPARRGRLQGDLLTRGRNASLPNRMLRLTFHRLCSIAKHRRGFGAERNVSGSLFKDSRLSGPGTAVTHLLLHIVALA